MKKYVVKKEVETTTEIGNFCGFVTSEGIKGYLVYTGDDFYRISAVLVEETLSADVPNTSCGRNLTFDSTEDFTKNSNTKFEEESIGVIVEDIYFFDTLKEMHRWLSE